MKFDEHGLIVQQNGDGGDTCARTGEYYIGLKIAKFNNEDLKQWPSMDAIDLMDALAKLEIEPGVYVRHPFQKQYSDPYKGDFSTSRDQTFPIIIVCGFYKLDQFLSRLFIRQLKHFGFFPNGKDISGFDVWASFARSFWACRPSIVHWPIYVLAVLLGDLQTLFGIILRCYKGKKDHDDVGDDVLLIQYLCYARYIFPSGLSNFNLWLYKKLRPFAGPKDEVKFLAWWQEHPEWNGAYSALAWYHRPESGGNPIDKLYFKELIK